MIIQICPNACQTLPSPRRPTTLVKISIKTNKPKQTSQHQRTGLHLIKTFSAASSSSGVPMKTVYACQGSQLALACPPDHQIRVMRANYGRFSVAICNDKGITDWSVNCMAPRSLRIMQDRWVMFFVVEMTKQPFNHLVRNNHPHSYSFLPL